MCFHPQRAEELENDPGIERPSKRKATRRLKKEAVPTLFSFRSAPPPARPSLSERRAVGARRALEHGEAKKRLERSKVPEAERKLQDELVLSRERVAELEKTVNALSQDVKLLKTQQFRFDNIKDDSKQLEFFTGLNRETWDCLWGFLGVSSSRDILSAKAAASEKKGRKILPGSGRKFSLAVEDQLLMTMMRLRLGRLQQELAYCFGVSEGTASNIFHMWINFLYLRLGMIPIWPDWEDVAASMPESFKASYPDTFIIIDATELRCQIPSSLSLQSQLYSSYKSHTTVKGLVGIAPNGAFTFISQLYTGCISDRQLVIESGILPLLELVPAGKRVMADRGFEIQDLLVKSNLILNIPPFKGNKSFLSLEDVVKTQKIAAVRIHVERAIGRVKTKFQIFDRDIPLEMFGCINQMWSVCCLLTNFLGPLITAPDEGAAK